MGEEIEESSPCSRAEEAGPNAWCLARLINPQICMKSVDVNVAAAYVRFRLGLLQHMCRDTTLGQRKKVFFDRFENLVLAMEITGWDLLQDEDEN